MRKCDKRNILYRQWGSSSPKAALVLVHGLGGHSNNWEFLANYFLAHNISSYALELKGFGNTEGLKGHIDSLNTYIKDVRRLYNIVKKDHRGRPVFIAGESMGGLIAFLTAIKKPGLFRGMVCMSPGFASALRFSLLDYMKMVAARVYNSRKQFVMPVTTEMCTRDPDCKKIIESDMLEHRFATPALLHSILWGQLMSQFLKHKVRTDTLFLISGNDTFTNSDVSKKLFEGIKFENKKLIEYTDMSHCLNMEMGREKVFADLLKWLEKRI